MAKRVGRDASVHPSTVSKVGTDALDRFTEQRTRKTAEPEGEIIEAKATAEQLRTARRIMRALGNDVRMTLELTQDEPPRVEIVIRNRTKD